MKKEMPWTRSRPCRSVALLREFALDVARGSRSALGEVVGDLRVDGIEGQREVKLEDRRRAADLLGFAEDAGERLGIIAKAGEAAIGKLERTDRATQIKHVYADITSRAGIEHKAKGSDGLGRRHRLRHILRVLEGKKA